MNNASNLDSFGASNALSGTFGNTFCFGSATASSGCFSGNAPPGGGTQNKSNNFTFYGAFKNLQTETGTTQFKYTPSIDQDSIGESCNFHCITSMEHYKNKSYEELRFEDYNIAREKAFGPSYCYPRFAKDATPAGSPRYFLQKRTGLFNHNRFDFQETMKVDACTQKQPVQLNTKPIQLQRPLTYSSTIQNPQEVPLYTKFNNQLKIAETEFDVFCKSLAIQLNNMPEDIALSCQEKLQSVMTKTRLAIIDSPSTHRSSTSPIREPMQCPAAILHGSTVNVYVSSSGQEPFIKRIQKEMATQTSQNNNIFDNERPDANLDSTMRSECAQNPEQLSTLDRKEDVNVKFEMKRAEDHGDCTETPNSDQTGPVI